MWRKRVNSQSKCTHEVSAIVSHHPYPCRPTPNCPQRAQRRLTAATTERDTLLSGKGKRSECFIPILRRIPQRTYSALFTFVFIIEPYHWNSPSQQTLITKQTPTQSELVTRQSRPGLVKPQGAQHPTQLDQSPPLRYIHKSNIIMHY